MTKKNNQKAYIALIALVILGAFTLILAVSLNKINITDLKLITSEQISNEAFFAADACAEEALLRLKRDPAFREGNLNIRTANCTISITANGDQRTITATGVSEEYIREIETIVNLTTNGSAINASTVSWKEK